MNTIEAKKLKTIERLLNTKDEKILDEINRILDLEVASYTIPEEHYAILKEDHEKYLKGQLKTTSFDQIEARLKKRYGI